MGLKPLPPAEPRKEAEDEDSSGGDLVMMNWYRGMGWDGWLAGSVMMLAFCALVVVAVIALVRSWLIGRPGFDRRTPRELLDDRFARGEIDVEEHARRSELLRRGH
jgi:putative membrane protein